jgi:hypothetical protein
MHGTAHENQLGAIAGERERFDAAMRKSNGLASRSPARNRQYR